ncbi:hypothetical protein BEN49_21515 [Hymenobacter coccineus]|uniref:TonB-dependent receptor plug domain-containing protein n=1 Tax=Hymenobacter coccineus TaxID=1908235 RepID=A0A1G1TJ96_9BACT|nr:hypothetical protein BEN49_21515 [Hymenobacter coccineus]
MDVPASVATQRKQTTALVPTGAVASARPVIPAPVYILNSRFIIGDLGTVNPTDIADIVVYRSPSVPALWRSLAANGIISITLRNKFKLQTQTPLSITRGLKLASQVKYKVNGLLLEDTSLRIVTSDIAGLDVTRATPESTDTFVNIRLIQSEPNPSRNPPNTIQIRGTAAR